jgi:hypothetical protein
MRLGILEFFRRRDVAKRALLHTVKPVVVTETDRLADILHSAGVNAFTHPHSMSGAEWHEYRKDIASFLIRRGVRLPESEMKWLRSREGK